MMNETNKNPFESAVPVTTTPSTSQPSLIVTAAVSSNTPVEEQIARPKLDLKNLLLLVFVFMFVSLMVGTLIWILQHEYSKQHPKTQSVAPVFSVI